MADSPFFVDVTEDNYQQVVVEGSTERPVLVDFWASWCQPCQILLPVLEKLAEEYSEKLVFAKVNTEEEQQLAMMHQVRSIPTVKLFHHGEEIDQFSGALPENQIRAFIEKYIPNQTTLKLEEVRNLIQMGDLDKAEKQLTELSEDTPENSQIQITKAQLKSAQGRFDQAIALLNALPDIEQLSDQVKTLKAHIELTQASQGLSDKDELKKRLEENATDSEARYQLAVRLSAENNYEEALAHLYELIKTDRAYGDDAGRKTMLQLFDSIPDHALVTKYRARMYNILY